MAQAFEDDLKARKELRPRTIYDYRRLIKIYLADWADKSISAISKNMISKRHAKMGKPVQHKLTSPCDSCAPCSISQPGNMKTAKVSR